MYTNSGEHVFALIESVRRRAARLLDSAQGAREAEDDPDDLAPLSAMMAGPELRLPQLVERFGLSPLAVEVLVCLLAVELDPFLRILVRSTQRDSGRPWLELGTVVELLDLPLERVPELARQLAPDAPLRRWALVDADDHDGREVPIVATRLKLAQRIALHLGGVDVLPREIRVVEPRVRSSRSLVPAGVAAAAVARLQRALTGNESLLLDLVGAEGCGKRFFAEEMAAQLGRMLVIVDLAPVAPIDLEARLAEGAREAKLADALLCLANLDSHLPKAEAPRDEHSPPPEAPRHLPPILARFFAAQLGPVVVTVREPQPLLAKAAGASLSVVVPFPTPSQRASLLARAFEQNDVAVDPTIDLVAMSRRFALDPGRIEAVARDAKHAGVVVGHAELHDMAMRHLQHDLQSVATRVVSSHRWEDLVVSCDVYDSLCEMISYAQHAEQVYDRWGFAGRKQAQGLSALFAGPPGTGKTMCASVMARELDMELFRVDLSRVVSKWIGETEKNLGKIFDEAARSNAVILFDEADALFAKRTEVKSSVDRYANLEVNYLLQKMEAFNGVTILTTNFEDTIDTAFKRRLTFRLRFERPDASARAALWSKAFPKRCALAPDVSAEKLGELYEMAGGNIVNAAVRAAFMAAAGDHPIDMLTCMHAAERECREMGILIPSHLSAENVAAAKAAVAKTTPKASPSKIPIGPPSLFAPPQRLRPAPRLVPITHRRES